MTDSHVVYDPSPCLIWLIHFQGSPFTSVTLLIQVHLQGTSDRWFIHTCDMKYSYLWHDSLTTLLQQALSMAFLFLICSLSLPPSLSFRIPCMQTRDISPDTFSYKLSFPNLTKSVIKKKELELHILSRCLSLAVPHNLTRPPPPFHIALIGAKICA